MSLLLGFVRHGTGSDGMNPSAGSLAELHDGLVGPDPAHTQVAEWCREVRLPGYLHRAVLGDAKHLRQFRQGDDLRWRTHHRTLSTCTLAYLYAGPGEGAHGC